LQRRGARANRGGFASLFEFVATPGAHGPDATNKEGEETRGYWLYEDTTRGKWYSGRVHCLGCESIWIAVWPARFQRLVCPTCGEPRGEPW
jgi:hypothetical protein